MAEQENPDEADSEIVGGPIPVPVEGDWIASGVGYDVDDPED